MAHDAKEGHLNGALSAIDILVALYDSWFDGSPDEASRPERDRLVFSKGHACTSVYSVWADRGIIPREWLFQYGQNDGPLPSHPCKYALGVLEVSSGSLGHGLGVAAGISYGLRLDGKRARVVALLSDGECNEGSTWEAAMFAAAKHLHGLLAIVDYNRIQSVGFTDELMGHTSLEEKFRAFGWETRTVDGHNLQELVKTLDEFPFAEARPSAIVAKTIAGAGVSFMENQVLWHYRVPSDEDLQRALKELGEAPIHQV